MIRCDARMVAPPSRRSTSRRFTAALAFGTIAAALASSPAAGQGGDWREEYAAARASSHAAYELAAMAFGGDSAQPARIRALAADAKSHVDSAKTLSPGGAVGRALDLLRNNLERLEIAFAPAALEMRIDTAGWDSLRRRILNEQDLRERPISREAVRSTLMGLEWEQRLNQRGTYVLYLHSGLRSIIGELDRLSALPEWRPGIMVGMYEENLLSIGVAVDFGKIFVAPSVLLAPQADRVGLELAVGVRSGDLAFVPGVVLLNDDGWRAAPSLTVLLVRPGWLSIGASVSELRGFGIRTVIDGPRFLEAWRAPR